jgi:hypothetical protein
MWTVLTTDTFDTWFSVLRDRRAASETACCNPGRPRHGPGGSPDGAGRERGAPASAVTGGLVMPRAVSTGTGTAGAFARVESVPVRFLLDGCFIRRSDLSRRHDPVSLRTTVRQ